MTELEQLRAWIDRYRSTLTRKTDGLIPSQLAERSAPPSSLSLLGLVRHLAQMEHHWFVRVLQRADEAQLYVPGRDWEAQFRDAVGTPECVEDAFETWRGVVRRADAFLDELPSEALAVVISDDPDDTIATIRDVVLQVISEYARHAGHMDLLRERIDGVTGV